MRETLWRITQWAIGLGVLILAFLYVQPHIPKRNVSAVDEQLPWVFRSSDGVFWSWVVGLGLIAGGSGTWVVRRLLAYRRVAGAGLENEAELDAAWNEIASAWNGTADSPVYFLFAPEASQALGLLASAGLSVESVAPRDSGGPLRGYVTSEGLMVWCGDHPGSTVAYVCKRLARLRPGFPPARGILAVLPEDCLDGPRALNLAAGFTAGIRAAVAGLEVCCPVFVMVTGMENQPGFLEFAKRMPPKSRDMVPLGFSLPDGVERERLAAGFTGFLRSYDREMLKLFAAEPLEQDGNERLYALSRRLESRRERLVRILEAVSAASDGDSVDLMGCYFAATGSDPEEWAYAPGVVQGRVVGDPNSARWSFPAIRTDLARRRAAWILLAVGGGLIVPVWGYILFGLGSLEWAGWIGFVAIAAGASWATLRGWSGRPIFLRGTAKP